MCFALGPTLCFLGCLLRRRPADPEGRHAPHRDGPCDACSGSYCACVSYEVYMYICMCLLSSPRGPFTRAHTPAAGAGAHALPGMVARAAAGGRAEHPTSTRAGQCRYRPHSHPTHAGLPHLGLQHRRPEPSCSRNAGCFVCPGSQSHGIHIPSTARDLRRSRPRAPQRRPRGHSGLCRLYGQMPSCIH